MSALDPAAMQRFGKFVALLGSDQLGERAAAGRAATRLLEAHGMSWHDIIAMLTPAPARVPRARASAAHQIDARTCLASGRAWREHEADFLRKMARQRARPSDRQLEWLEALVSRAPGGAA